MTEVQIPLSNYICLTTVSSPRESILNLTVEVSSKIVLLKIIPTSMEKSLSTIPYYV